jgi:hypothetical protein
MRIFLDATVLIAFNTCNDKSPDGSDQSYFIAMRLGPLDSHAGTLPRAVSEMGLEAKVEKEAPKPSI